MSGRSRASRPGMVKRDPAAYGPAVRRLYDLLRSAGAAFDDDHPEQIVSLAAALRGLLLGGTPLLQRVCKLSQLRFVDSVDYTPPPPNVFWSSGGGLVVMNFNADRGRVQARFDLFEHAQKTTRFSEWWNRDLAVVGSNSRHTRRWLVDALANSDALHFDGHIEGEYDQLARDNYPGWRHTAGDVDTELEGDVATASLRQIAWETEKTLISQLPHIVDPD